MFNLCSKLIPPVKEGLQAKVSVSRLSHQRQRDHAASVDSLGRRGIHQNVLKVQFTLAAACDAISQAYDDEVLDVVNSELSPRPASLPSAALCPVDQRCIRRAAVAWAERVRDNRMVSIL